jgi:hypothetical protein
MLVISDKLQINSGSSSVYLYAALSMSILRKLNVRAVLYLSQLNDQLSSDTKYPEEDEADE